MAAERERGWFLDGTSRFIGFRYEAPGRVRLQVREEQNYVATARSGDVVCTASVDRRTRTNAQLRAEVVGERLIATAIGSFAIFPAKPRGGAPPPGS